MANEDEVVVGMGGTDVGDGRGYASRAGVERLPAVERGDRGVGEGAVHDAPEVVEPAVSDLFAQPVDDDDWFVGQQLGGLPGLDSGEEKQSASAGRLSRSARTSSK